MRLEIVVPFEGSMTSRRIPAMDIPIAESGNPPSPLVGEGWGEGESCSRQLVPTFRKIALTRIGHGCFIEQPGQACGDLPPVELCEIFLITLDFSRDRF